MGDLQEYYENFTGIVSEIDVKLDSLNPDVSGKSNLIKSWRDPQQERANEVIKGLASQIEDQPAIVKVGFYYAFSKSLDAIFKEIADKTLEENLANAPKVEPLVTEVEAEELRAKRAEIVTNLKQVIALAKAMGVDDGMEEPPKRTGKSGKRGPRQLSLYDYTVKTTEGKTVEYDGLKEIQEAYDKYFDKVAELTAFIRGDKPATNEDGSPKVNKKGEPVIAKGTKVDTTNPPAEFNVTLPNGDVLVAVRNEEDAAADAEETATEEVVEEAAE